jgi:fatty-acyl-CoA synthase
VDLIRELLLHTGIEDAAVVAVADETWGEVGVAFVVARAPGCLTAEDLTGFLGQRLARFKIPKNYLFLDSLPHTPYGKVVKGEFRERFALRGKE